MLIVFCYFRKKNIWIITKKIKIESKKTVSSLKNHEIEPIKLNARKAIIWATLSLWCVFFLFRPVPNLNNQFMLSTMIIALMSFFSQFDSFFIVGKRHIQIAKFIFNAYEFFSLLLLNKWKKNRIDWIFRCVWLCVCVCLFCAHSNLFVNVPMLEYKMWIFNLTSFSSPLFFLCI